MASSTERALADSLKKLMRTKTLDKITVRDITDDCGVNRQTFYYHFRDVYDLVEWIFRYDAERIVAAGSNEESWQEIVRRMIDEVLAERNFVLNTYYSLNRRELDLFMQALVRPMVTAIFDKLLNGRRIRESDRMFVIEIQTYASTGVLMEWVGTGMREKEIWNVDRICEYVETMLEASIRKYEERP